MKFEYISYEILKRTLEIYVDLAYINGIKEQNFCYNNYENLIQAKDKKEFISNFNYQEINFGNNKFKKRYSVQLGSDSYPFLKLALQEAEEPNDFYFLIDRHTEYLGLMPDSETFEEEIKLKEYTKEIKEKIEDKFDALGIPTYRKFVREEIEREEVQDTLDIEKKDTRVLLVEDNEDIQMLHKLKLQHLGYDVEAVGNGEDAIKAVRDKKNFNIMILDLMMPTISGFEVIEHLAKEIPIIVVTALSDALSMKRCINGGAKIMLTKPVDFEYLDNFIVRIIKETQQN